MGPKDLSLEELLCRHIQDVYRYMWLTCGDRHLAQDMTQETLCRALAGRGGFRGTSTVRTWLFAIARNVYLSTTKREALRARLRSGRGAAVIAEALSGSPPEGPEEAATGAEERLVLKKALAGLSERHRMLLLLREYWELSYNEISEVMGISLGSVKKNLHLAREQLRLAFLDMEESGGYAVDAARGQEG